MRFAYNWGLIDANYILFRNKNMLASNSPTGIVSENDLLTTTIQSFIKLKRAASFKYPILIWDKSPYYKVKTIQAYKADRWLPSDEVYANLETEKAQCTDEKRIKEIEVEQKKIKDEQENFSVAKNIKKLFLSDEFKSFGFHSLIRSGYEADDLAFLTAYEISNRYKLDKNNTAILLTADKDWTNFQLPGVDFLSTYNWSSYINLTEKFEEEKDKINKASMKLYGVPCSVTRYQWGVLEELMHASHNNGVVWNHKRANRPEAIAKFFHRDRSLPDFDVLDNAYQAMNMLIGKTTVMKKQEDFSEAEIQQISYVDDTKPAIDKALSEHYYEFGSFFEYCNKNFIILGFENYDMFIDGLDRI